eukprot:650666-Rhodomonas_salina.1
MQKKRSTATANSGTRTCTPLPTPSVPPSFSPSLLQFLPSSLSLPLHSLPPKHTCRAKAVCERSYTGSDRDWS